MRCHQLLFIVDYMKRLHFLEIKKFVKILILFLTIQISSFIYNSFISIILKISFLKFYFAVLDQFLLFPE